MTFWKKLLTDWRIFKASLDDRTTWQASLLKAVGFEVTQHVRNRLALGLVIFFIPCWLGLVRAIIPANRIDFHSRITRDVLSVNANELAMISGAINAVTLIVGFMMYAAMRRSSDFDQRLVLAGYSRPTLLLAKLAALLLISTVIACYATVVMELFWAPRQPWLLAVSLLSSALTYGGMGIVLGAVLSTELAGMFVIIMVSLVDVMVQNPIINPASNQDVVRFLPTYGAMQSGAAAGFSDRGSAGYALLGTVWLTAFALFGMAAFYLRTKDHARQAAAVRSTTEPATVTLTTRADGSLVVQSFAGPVLLCSQLEVCTSTCERPAITKAASPPRNRTRQPRQPGSRAVPTARKPGP